MEPFENKVALITGGARGIGRAVAFRLGSLGAKIVLNDNGSELDTYHSNADILHNTVGELFDSGIQCIGNPIDISIPSNCYRLAGDVQEKLGGIDYLIHCAAIRTNAQWPEVNGMMIRNTFFTNVFSSIFLTNICSSYMQKRGGGYVALFGSGVINDGPPGTALYASSKAAVDTYSRVVAQELQKFKIKLDCIWPAAKTRLNPKSDSEPHDIANFISDRIIGYGPSLGHVFSVNGKDVCLVTDRTYAPIEE